MKNKITVQDIGTTDDTLRYTLNQHEFVRVFIPYKYERRKFEGYIDIQINGNAIEVMGSRSLQICPNVSNKVIINLNNENT